VARQLGFRGNAQIPAYRFHETDSQLPEVLVVLEAQDVVVAHREVDPEIGHRAERIGVGVAEPAVDGASFQEAEAGRVVDRGEALEVDLEARRVAGQLGEIPVDGGIVRIDDLG
jgi:hypothetical protein